MHCDPRFSRVREVFERHFADGVELGAAFAVYLDGELVVDLWDGVADRRTGRPWERDTPVFAYSCTKAVTATVLLRLAERGLVDVTAPVAEVWPEFGVQGKQRVTVEHLLSHQAGLPALEEPVPVEEFEDLPAIAARLAGQRPIWRAGSMHGYHALTYGFLVGEVVRRVTGKSVGELVAAEISGPLGLDLWVGAPDDVIARAARLSAGPPPGSETGRGDGAPGAPVGAATPSGPPQYPNGGIAVAAQNPDSLMNRTLGNPSIQDLKGGANNPVILRAGWPAAGMVTTARSLAAFYRALLAGELLRPETLQDAIRPRVTGPDQVLLLDSSFGLGFMRPGMTFFLPSATAFGHTGMGGSIGLADPEHGLAAGYVMNRMADAFSGNLRAIRLMEAVYRSI
ncbi:serine hydrolase domain-containing protein [Nonomuraea guangzhouensis]|uniref:Serine hydrolase domain-containing protein n=1 Tax=Nonomuraea guangzhouensis TaxID=1291555 RepID=A0ABW4GVG4_9ACTN|nr:serine hydrolase domain-containing protein [Nonomuraea guangzhouensis]